MLIASVIIVLGFLGLIWGADKFVAGASGLARNLGVSPLLIGLTIVAFGTSAPEIFSSAVAAMQKKPELAIGNAFGSNLFNVGIALGIAALIKPLKAPESMLNRELPALLLVTVITGILIADLQLDLLDAILLIMITVFFIYRVLKQQKKSTKPSFEIFNQLGPADVNEIDFEDKVLLFPRFDSLSIGLALESEGRNVMEADLNPLYDSLSECVVEIEELKNELTTIVMSQTSSGQGARDKWDTPDAKVGNQKRGKLRKDRYSSLIIANMIARQIANQLSPVDYDIIGGDTRNMTKNSDQLYKGPSWFTDAVNEDIYRGIQK